MHLPHLACHLMERVRVTQTIVCGGYSHSIKNDMEIARRPVIIILLQKEQYDILLIILLLLEANFLMQHFCSYRMPMFLTKI